MRAVSPPAARRASSSPALTGRSRAIPLILLLALAAACTSSPPPSGSPPTFTPRGLPSPSATGPAAGLSPTLTPVPLGRLPGSVTTYRFDVALDYVGRRAQVIQSVEAINPGPDTWVELVFQMPAAVRSASFILNSVSVSEGGVDEATPYQVTENLLRVPLPGGVPPNAAALVKFSYGLAAAEARPTTRPPEGNVGYSSQVIQFVNWYPVLVPYRQGSGWQAAASGPGKEVAGDPVFAEVANYELTVTSRRDVVVVSGGPLAHTPGRWTFSLRNARTIAIAASAEYESVSQTEGGVTVTSYYLPGHAAAGQDVLMAVARSMALFTDTFGPYPYTTLAVAENAYAGSAAAGGVVLHTGQGYAEYPGTPDSLLIALVPQAVSRLWWGQIVSGDPFAEPWLNEALPMYAELLFDQAYYPDLESWYWEARVDYWQPSGPLNRSVAEFDDTEDYLRNLLRRGAQFLRDLRAEMGDDAFFAFVGDFYRNGAYRTVTAADFFNALRRHTALDLDELLAEYFRGQVMPTPAPTLTARPTDLPPGSPAPTAIIHAVRAGETLTFIANKYGVTVDAIVQANGLADANAIFVGQKLVIPPPP